MLLTKQANILFRFWSLLKYIEVLWISVLLFLSVYNAKLRERRKQVLKIEIYLHEIFRVVEAISESEIVVGKSDTF